MTKSGATYIDLSGRDVIKAQATVQTLESMLKVEMWEWVHRKSGVVRVAHHGALVIPDEFDDAIDLISGVSELYGPSVIKPVRRSLFQATDAIGNDVTAGYIIPQVLRNVYGYIALADLHLRLVDSSRGFLYYLVCQLLFG